MGKKNVFGCDIGNGFGYISVLNDAQTDPIPMFPAKYKLDAVGMPTSAYIAPPDGENIEIYDGRPACHKYKRESDKFIHAVKTRLKEGSIPVPGIRGSVSVDKVYGAIARDLIKLGNEQRRNRGETEIYDVVFTYPAFLTTDLPLLNKMQSSIEQCFGTQKKVSVVGRLPEPAAVAIDYLYYMQNIAPEVVRLHETSFTALVYDLGHGTFDIAVVTARSKGEPYKLHYNAGLPEVGGKNFDEIIYKEICKILKIKYGYTPKNSNEREIIRLAAIEMKHDLTADTKSSHSIIISDGDVAEVELTREWFEESSRYLINQTFELVDRVIQQAAEGNVNINAVVLSGGSSQMPMVKKGLDELLKDNNIPVVIYRPSEAVSYGAARYAFGIKDKPIPESEHKPEPKTETQLIPTQKIVPSSAISFTHQNEIDESRDVGTQYSNTVLEQYTEYGYGIWMPSEESERGKIDIFFKGGVKLPTNPAKLVMSSKSSRLTVRLYRTRYNCNSIGEYVLQTDDEIEEKFESVMRVPFNVPANTKCEIQVLILEDRNIKVICNCDNGELISKSTIDSLQKLVGGI